MRSRQAALSSQTVAPLMPPRFFVQMDMKYSHRLPQTCGAYFTAGANRIRLVRFLHKLQRYLFCKPDPPRSVEFAVLDMIDDMEMQMRKLDLKKETKR